MINPIILLPQIKYWVWIATLYLIFLTFKDFKNRGFVDDRHNWVMMGISLSLLSQIPIALFKLLGIVATIIIFRIYFIKFKVIGEADTNALAWIFLGYGIMNYAFLLWFAIYFSIITVFYTLMKVKVFKIKNNTPFFIVLLATFWFNNYIFKLY